MALLVRMAELNDSEFICNLCNQLGYQTTNDKVLMRLSEISDNNDHCVFVALNDNDIVGWIHSFYSLRVESESFVEIGGLVTDKNYRNKGIGRMLVKRVMEWAGSKNCDKVRVRCRTIRKDAHRFYTTIGFSEIKEQKVFEMIL